MDEKNDTVKIDKTARTGNILRYTKDSNPPSAPRCARTSETTYSTTRKDLNICDHFEKDLMMREEICKKKIEAMKESDRTRTMKGSLEASNED